MSRRISVTFADSTYEALKDLAHEKGGDIALALRDVIALSKYVSDKRKNGAKLLIEEGDDIKEIIPL